MEIRPRDIRNLSGGAVGRRGRAGLVWRPQTLAIGREQFLVAQRAGCGTDLFDRARIAAIFRRETSACKCDGRAIPNVSRRRGRRRGVLDRCIGTGGAGGCLAPFALVGHHGRSGGDLPASTRGGGEQRCAGFRLPRDCRAGVGNCRCDDDPAANARIVCFAVGKCAHLANRAFIGCSRCRRALRISDGKRSLGSARQCPVPASSEATGIDSRAKIRWISC